MVTQYPSKIDDSTSLPEVIDLTSIFSADVYNRLRNAILAIETELGARPSAAYTSVKNRLNTLEDDISNFQIIILTNDLGGTLASPKVVGLQGVPVSPTAPTIGQVLRYNGAAWAAATMSGGGGGGGDFMAAGDLAGDSTAQVVVGLQNNAVSDAVPTDGYILTWQDLSSSWEPLAAPVGFSAGGDLTGSATDQQVISLTGDTGVVSVPTAALAFGTSPSSTGDIRLPKTGTVKARNYGDDGDIALLSIDNSDYAYFGNPSIGRYLAIKATGDDFILTSGGSFAIRGSSSLVTAYPPLALGFSATPVNGDLNLAKDFTIKRRNITNDGDETLFAGRAAEASMFIGSTETNTESLLYLYLNPFSTTYFQVNGQLQSYVDNNGTNIYSSLNLVSTAPLKSGPTPATAGVIRLSNNTNIMARKVGDDGNLVLVKSDDSNNVIVGGEVDGSNSGPQVFVSAGSFGYLRAGGTSAALWTSGNFMPATPVIGYNAPYGVHGGTTFTFIIDANYTVDAAVYCYDWIEFTTGGWVSGHSVIFPAPASKDKGYYKTIFNNTSLAITVSTGSGNTKNLLAGTTTRFWFDDTGVSIAGLITKIINSDISSSAAIAYSKLNLATSILNADINASAGIVYSKLSLTGSILNADINASAAIDYSKLGTGTQSIGAQQFNSTVDTKGTTRDVQPKNVQTTDATVTTLDSFTIASNTTLVVSAAITAVKSDNSQGASYFRSAAFRNNAGSVSQISATQDGGTFEDDVVWDATIDNSTTTIRIRVTGKAATTIRWTCVSTRLEVIP